MEPPINKAAYLPSKKSTKFEVRTAPFTDPYPNHIVIKNAAIAINPIDWLIPSRGDIMFTYLKYPFIMGRDLAGEVIKVGQGVTRFNIGDRVLGWSIASEQGVNDPAQATFQNYSIIREDLATKIPEDMEFEKAAVIPLGIATAATGLFDDKTGLNLDLPTEPPRPSNGKTVIIWGGSSSVGCNAIQLAVAAGYEVLTTASPKNHEYLKSLGAKLVFDYNSPTVVQDIISALKDKTTVGAISIGQGAAEKCTEILDKSQAVNKFVAMATFPVPLPDETKSFAILRMAATVPSWFIADKVRGVLRGTKTSFITIQIDGDVVKHIFGEFLPKALEKGTFVPAPEVEVVGKGLEAIQGACELQKKGVSAKKLVVTL